MIGVLLLSSAVAQAADVVPYSPFDLANGQIPLPAGHPLPEGEQDVRLLIPSASGVTVVEGCRVAIEATRVAELSGSQCDPIWKVTPPRSTALSINGSAVMLKVDVLPTKSLVAGIPPKKDAWVGFDHEGEDWVVWTKRTPPDEMVASVAAGKTKLLYARTEETIEQWGVTSLERGADVVAPKRAPGPKTADPVPVADAAGPSERRRPLAAALRPSTSSRGAVRIGVGAVLGPAVDHGYQAVAIGEDAETRVTDASDAPMDLDLVLGYAPFFRDGGRPTSGCGPVLQCVAPYFGLSVAGQGGSGAEWLNAAHVGLDFELLPAFAVQLTGVARRVTRLQDGVNVGDIVGRGDAPTMETVGLGGAVVISTNLTRR